MNPDAVIAFAVLLFAWSVVSGRLERLDVTGPIVFVAAGVLLCNGSWAVIDVTIESHSVHTLAEVTLAVDDPRVQTVIATIVMTVVLSVVVHGVSGRPLSTWMRHQEPASE